MFRETRALSAGNFETTDLSGQGGPPPHPTKIEIAGERMDGGVVQPPPGRSDQRVYNCTICSEYKIPLGLNHLHPPSLHTPIFERHGSGKGREKETDIG